MTDNEIIKALENIITYAKYIESNCVKIPVDLLQFTVDLIERRHTEIFELQLKIPKLEQENDELQREITNVYEEGLRLNNIFFGFVEKNKSEAVKEFANWLFSLFPKGKRFTTISRVAIKQKLNEMVGEKDEFN